jgi:branched-chain amino acid aminotransferase
VVERDIDLTELYIADEIFACGTSVYLAPVTEVDARVIADGKTGPLTARLREHYTAALHGQGAAHRDWLTLLEPVAARA